MLTSRRTRQDNDSVDQLLKLYSNRAGVKRELNDLRRERHELLDKLKDQEGAIVRAHEQLEGLERLLTDPLAAANAMVYFQLRHLWRVGSQKLEQFSTELKIQRLQRERTQLHDAALAKRSRRLSAIREKLESVVAKQDGLHRDLAETEKRLSSMNIIKRLFQAPGLRRRIAGMEEGNTAVQEKIDELRELEGKIQGELLPEPDGLSLESRRLINCAIIALAQYLVLHFHESDLAALTKTSTERPVGDMKFGDRRECDRMVERIRERIEDLRQQTDLAEHVRQRTDYLVSQADYRNETDALPVAESVASIAPLAPEPELGEQRRSGDAPVLINVLLDEYWGLYPFLCD